MYLSKPETKVVPVCIGLPVASHAKISLAVNEPLGAPDIPHYDSLSEIKLGHLFAEQLSYYIN